MNAIRPKGWCPTLFAPMSSGDGLLVRVRPPGGVLTAAAARTLADAATRFGNGVIELTNRAGIQVRGLRADTVAPFAAAMVAAGLAHPDPDAERRRIVLAPPLAGDDPSASPHAAEVARALEDLLVRDNRFSALPGKFGVLVDAGGVLPTRSAPADIRVLLQAAPQGEMALLLLDGSNLAAACAPGDAADAVSGLMFSFLALRGQRRRMHAVVAEAGAETVFAAAGLAASTIVAAAPTPTALGWLGYADGRGAFGVGLPFGAMDAATLAALADGGHGAMRLTPWRAIAISNVTAPDLVRADIATLGLIAGPGDPRATISACPGAPFCASATVATRTDAAQLVALGIGGSIHVSGCAKGCAHPAIADFTLVGDTSRYSIVRNGRAGDAPAHADLTLADLTLADLMDALRNMST